MSRVTGDMTVVALYTTDQCTVFFTDWDGAVLKTQTVAYGGAAQAPADPVREGYFFAGWSAPFDHVTASLIVRAQYVSGLPFVDVPENAWYYEAVLWNYLNHVINGVDETHFAPEAQTTRAQFVTMLYRLSGQQAPEGSSGFTDVPSEAYYASAVAWAAENQIVLGTGDGKFDPEAFVTREQLVTFLCRYVRYMDRDVTADRGSLERFPDVASVSPWAAEAMAWAVEQGIIQGEDGRLNPTAFATRAQCAAIFQRQANA